MSGLSDEDIREAAAEAGISPAELRQALAEQGSALQVRAPGREVALAVPASQRAAVVMQARANIPQPPPDAVRNVRASIEAQIGQKGHMHGAAEAGVYDEERGLIYRVRADEDGQGGALVQVDIDGAPAKGKMALAKIGLGATLAVLGMGGLVFGSFLALAVTVGIGVLGFGGLMAASRSKKAVYNQAHAIASHALIEAEERAPSAPKALPPT
jgi:hypothetical protein